MWRLGDFTRSVPALTAPGEAVLSGTSERPRLQSGKPEAERDNICTRLLGSPPFPKAYRPPFFGVDNMHLFTRRVPTSVYVRNPSF